MHLRVRTQDEKIHLLYLGDLGEALEVGIGVRRFGALFVRKTTWGEKLWPLQFLGMMEHTDEGATVWPIEELRIP